jgi:CBS domain-containing protein
MTAPAITIAPDAEINQAAARMRDHQVGRLPVVEEPTGHLIGIISRSDLIGLYSRPDAEIERDILNRVIATELAMDPMRFTVTVKHGRVTVHGKIERRSMIPMLLHVIRRMEGVVSVDSRLGYDDNGTPVRPSPYVGMPFR